MSGAKVPASVHPQSTISVLLRLWFYRVYLQMLDEISTDHSMTTSRPVGGKKPTCNSVIIFVRTLNLDLAYEKAVS